MGVGVERDDDLPARVPQAEIERRRLAAIGDGKQLDAGIFGVMRPDLLGGVVGRAVVDDDDLQIRIVARQDVVDDAEADSEDEYHSEKTAKPAQRHEYRQADELGV